MLKKKITKEEFEALSEELQKYYVSKDGAYELDIDNDAEAELKRKVSEFRDNNIKLKKDNEKLTEQFEELKTKFEEIESEARKKKEKELLDEGKIEELLEEKTKRMKADYENQVKALTEQVTEKDETLGRLKDTLSVIKIDNEIQLAVSKVGTVKQGYMEDVVSLGKRLFSMDDNDEPVALDKNGGKIVGKDGVSPLTIAEWAATLPTEKSAYFESNQGTGSKGSGTRSGSQTVDLSKISDPVERMKAYRARQAAS